MRRVWLAVMLLGCGHDTMSNQHPDAAQGSGKDAAIDTLPGNGWSLLISRTWSMMPGDQFYRCVRIQVPQDMWVTGFRALSPLGTHHEVLTTSSTSSPLGDYDCSAGSLDNQMLFAAGVNTDDLMFPTGVATHLTAGMYINLNLHLFDATDNALQDMSGVYVQTIPQSQVVQEADMMFSGTLTISATSDGAPHNAVGGCTAPTDWNVFALWPHMHQTGVHQTFVVNHAGTPNTMLDVPYSFVEQKNYPMPEFVIHQGDAVQTTCTYQWSAACSSTQPCMFGSCGTDSMCHETFGESSTAEMCFTGMYKYPAGGNLLGCVSM